MTKIDLEAQLRMNEGAAKHADSIRGAIQSLENLRKNGIAPRGYTLASPFGGRSKIPDGTKPRPLSRIRLKLTDEA